MAAVRRNGSLLGILGVQDLVQVYQKRKRLALTSTPLSGRPRIKHRISDFSRPRGRLACQTPGGYVHDVG